MLNLDWFDDRYIPPVHSRGSAFFPAYCQSDLEVIRYLQRREVNRDKDPFIPELGYGGDTGDNLVGD
jgi:hypothetical protein